MSMFFTKNDAPFIPEAINPELANLAKAIVKTCHLSLKLQMRTNGLNSAMNSGDLEQMKEITFKCIEKNRGGYNSDMSLTGVRVAEVDDEFFADKDVEFYKGILAVLIDMAAIRTVVDARMMPIMSAACQKALNKPINTILFFTNQTEILEDVAEDEAEDEAAAEEAAEE